jgi:enoyl-CoA hydratase/carnithine racemase
MYFGIRRAVNYVNEVTRGGEPSALILTGVGDVFAPGGEMTGNHPDVDPRASELLREVGNEMLPFEALRNSAAPGVSAVNGICQGGGLLIAMLSDVAVVSERATFRAPELLRGVADAGYAAYLPPQIGVARARDLLFTARRLDADEAVAMGLVARKVPHERLLDEAREVAEAILMTAPDARLQLKKILNANYGKVDLMTFAASLYGPETAEGFAAFGEKRTPAWVPQTLRSGKRL